MRPPLFILGYMACGKTTFGRALARATGREFIDLDFYIEQRFHKSIPEIFAVRGENDFRRMESAMLREVGEFENVIIACGGGTPCFNDNMDYMLGQGTTLFLEASEEKIVSRLIENSSRRPLMAGKKPDEIRPVRKRRTAGRMPCYTRAHLRFSGEELEDRNQISISVSNFLDRYISII